MLIGRKDAWALMGIGAGIAASSPWLAGNAVAAVAAAGLPALGASWLAKKKTDKWLSRVDTKSKEGFVLPSDVTGDDKMPICAPDNAGIRIGYTKDNGMPVDVNDSFLTRHFAIIGQSGVGKTTLGEYILYQQSVVRGGGYIFIDAKIDAATRDKLSYMMKMAGREDEFFVLNVDDPTNSNTYNPVLSGDPDEVASRLINLLPSSDASPGADFFKQQSFYALTVLVGALKSAKRRYHFADLAILLQSDKALEELLRLPMSPEAKLPLEVFLNQFRKRDKNGTVIDVQKVKEILGGMSGRIAQFAQNKFGQLFNTYLPEINLTDIVMKGHCLYCMLPTMGKDQSALNLGKMILSDLRTAVYKVQGLKPQDRPNPPFLVFADELGSYVMPGIARLFEQARSANICMIPAFQTFANLSTVSPDFADIIIGNTWSKAFFKFASKDSPAIAAEIIGMTKKFQKSYSKSENEGDSAQNLRANPSGSSSSGQGMAESFREMEDFRVHPDQLKSMGMGEVVLMVGPRIFHISTPMLLFPDNIPEFKVLRRKVYMPEDEMCIDLSSRYKEFMMVNDVPQPGAV